MGETVIFALSLDIKQTTTYYVGYPGPDFELNNEHCLYIYLIKRLTCQYRLLADEKPTAKVRY
jgi:hypothetical protein